MLALAFAGFALAVDAPLPLKDGDKVVLLGSTLFERASTYGYWEAAALARHPGMRIAFRNYAWSGDTVRCQARSYFGPPKEGFDRLKANLEREKPTAAVLCYGANESAAGPDGIVAFVADYKRLIEMVKASSPGVRLLLVSHPPRPGGKLPIPDQSAINKNIAHYNAASEKLAKQLGLAWSDFGGTFQLKEQHSDDGATLAEFGYFVHQNAFANLFLAEPKQWHQIPANPRADGRTIFVPPKFPPGKWRLVSPEGQLVMQVVAGKLLGESAPHGASSTGEKLLQAILKKERLVFNRWRPQNETYLFGFRKHEQGNNGVEIPQFDPLIAKADDEIAKLMKEPPYRLEPITEASK